MFEVRIELIEVDKPGGEIIGVPLVALRSEAYDHKEEAKQLTNSIIDKVESFEER